MQTPKKTHPHPRTPTIPAKARELLDLGEQTYALKDGQFTCRLCGKTSHNKMDARNKFCGNCHVFHEDIIVAYKLVTRNDDRIDEADLVGHFDDGRSSKTGQ
jgi:hypothetical protein